jgi:hypothetical protein
MVALAACQGSGAGTASPVAGRPASPAHAAVRTLAAGCTHDNPCQNITAGAYRLGSGTLLPGLELTLPAGWSSTGTGPAQLNLVPPGLPDDFVDFWLDMLAVKSTGPGHGTTILTNVDTKPSALLAWLTRKPDLRIVSKLAPATIGQDSKMTSLVVGVSRSANYGDPACPPNPRCADLFTNRKWSDFYGLAGDEEIRLYLGTTQISGSPHTLMVALDAGDQYGLLHLENLAKPVIGSVTPGTGLLSQDSERGQAGSCGYASSPGAGDPPG